MNRISLYLLGCTGLLTSNIALASESEDFHALVQRCAPSVSSHIMAPLVKVESSFNRYAIGVVGGRLSRQATNKAEAVATANALKDAGLRFSAGLGQVYMGNWAAYGLTSDSVFETCENIRASAGIYNACYKRAIADIPDPELARNAAYSCYYSNNFTTGLTADSPGQIPYVQKVLNSAAELAQLPPPVVKPITFIPNSATTGSKKPAQATLEKPSSPEQVDFDAQVIPPSTPPVVVNITPPDAEPAQPEKSVVTAPAAPKKPASNPYVYTPETAEPSGEQSAMVY